MHTALVLAGWTLLYCTALLLGSLCLANMLVCCEAHPDETQHTIYLITATKFEHLLVVDNNEAAADN
jgi:hypothetical protein